MAKKISMILDKKQKNNGFTLIELLVVIAIIALLSTIVLSSLNLARIRAQNSAKIQEFDQITKALELFRDQYGGYPYFGNVTNSSNPEMYCIGYINGEKCFGVYSDVFGSFVGNGGIGGLNEALSEFIQGPPKNTSPVEIGQYDYKGIVYGCSELGDRCTNYAIWWYLVSESSCPKGAISVSSAGNVLCQFNSSNKYD